MNEPNCLICGKNDKAKWVASYPSQGYSIYYCDRCANTFTAKFDDMKTKEIKGVVYKSKSANQFQSCESCAGHGKDELCQALGWDCLRDNSVWVFDHKRSWLVRTLIKMKLWK